MHILRRWSKPHSTLAALGIFSLLFILVAPGCHDDESLGPPSGQQSPWTLISHTDCKAQANALAGAAVPSDMDCVVYHYSAERNTLGIKHINAAFNCCPGDITADVTVADGAITIAEHEAQSMCDCSCLYDLEYEIRNVEPRRCMLRIIEPYVDADDERLELPIDLTSTPDGFVCRYRDHYPWTYQSTMSQDSTVLHAMREEIVEVIGSPSCSGGGECRSVPLGVKPCGGPWEYLIYSAAAVSESALEFRVSKYNAFNDAFNRRYHVVSDCRYVLPPDLRCADGVCTDLTGRE
jgi:hypothetical protein